MYFSGVEAKRESDALSLLQKSPWLWRWLICGVVQVLHTHYKFGLSSAVQHSRSTVLKFLFSLFGLLVGVLYSIVSTQKF